MDQGVAVDHLYGAGDGIDPLIGAGSRVRCGVDEYSANAFATVGQRVAAGIS